MSANNASQKLLSGAFVLAAGSFLSKLIGAAYRIPLMSVLGAEGMGVYQLIFPLYSLLLAVSGSAIPIVVARSIATQIAKSGGIARGFTAKCMLLYGGAAAVLSVVLVLLSGVISGIQASPRANLAYIAIAPSIFLVAIISVIRGEFQGQGSMVPTAVSQVTEQLVKVPLGFVFASLFMPNIALSVAAAALSITVSEAAALVFLLLMKRKRARSVSSVSFSVKCLASESLSVMLGSVVFPLVAIIDSMTVVRILSFYTDGAEAMYGILSGGVFSLINLPVGITAAVAAALLPAVSVKFARGENVDLSKPLFAMLLVSAFSAGVFLFLANEIGGVLFPSFAPDEQRLFSNLLALSSVNVLLLAVNQLLTSFLQGIGRAKIPALSIAIGAVVKMVLSSLLLSNPSIHIFGAVISANVCYLLATIFNLVYIICRCKRVRYTLRSVILPLVGGIVAAAVMRAVALSVDGFLGLAVGGVGALAVLSYMLFLQLKKRRYTLYDTRNRSRNVKRRYFRACAFHTVKVRKNHT